MRQPQLAALWTAAAAKRSPVDTALESAAVAAAAGETTRALAVLDAVSCAGRLALRWPLDAADPRGALPRLHARDGRYRCRPWTPSLTSTSCGWPGAAFVSPASLSWP